MATTSDKVPQISLKHFVYFLSGLLLLLLLLLLLGLGHGNIFRKWGATR